MSYATTAMIAAISGAALTACSFRPGGGGGDDGAADDASAGDAAGDDGAAGDATIDAAGAIDAASGIDARPACPGNYGVVSGGGRYRFETTAALWGVAAAECNDDLVGRTHLATFENNDLDAVMNAANPGNSAQVHVGAACAFGATCSLTASWAWVTGSVVNDRLWASGQPDLATEDVAESSRVQGTWSLDNVSSLSATRPYLCECDP